MLCYAWNRLEEKEEINVSRSDEKDISLVLTGILIRKLKVFIKQGYYREYIDKQEETATIRGKINFPDSLNELTFKSARMYCEFDELSYDILHNQIIKTTLYKLSRHSLVKTKYGKEIKRILPYFADIQHIRLTKQTFKQVRIHRNNRQYGFLIEICKFLYESLLIHEDRHGTESLSDFNKYKVSMATLFEDFVRSFYKEELKNNDSVKIERMSWHKEPNGKNDYLPAMITDISIEVNNNKKIVMDTKFYEKTLPGGQTKDKIKSANLYQIIAYLSHTENKFKEKPTGILLYPRIDEDLGLSYTLLGYPVKIYTVDLNADWQEIREWLIEIIDRERF